MIGMAVNSGQGEERRQLIQVLECAAMLSHKVELWIEGRPFDVTLQRIARQLETGVRRR